MLSVFTRAAGGLVCALLAAIFGTAGTVIGAVMGFLSGFSNEDGLMEGILVGAIVGALVSVEFVHSLVNTWRGCCDESMDTRIRRTILAAGSLLPTISSALGSQIDVQQRISGRGENRGGIFEPSYPVMAARTAIVHILLVTDVTTETAGHQTTCPICLDEFQPGDTARSLSACCHLFHLSCIDSWLMWNYQCPLCRQAVN